MASHTPIPNNAHLRYGYSDMCSMLHIDREPRDARRQFIGVDVTDPTFLNDVKTVLQLEETPTVKAMLRFISTTYQFEVLFFKINDSVYYNVHMLCPQYHPSMSYISNFIMLLQLRVQLCTKAGHDLVWKDEECKYITQQWCIVRTNGIDYALNKRYNGVGWGKGRPMIDFSADVASFLQTYIPLYTSYYLSSFTQPGGGYNLYSGTILTKKTDKGYDYYLERSQHWLNLVYEIIANKNDEKMAAILAHFANFTNNPMLVTKKVVIIRDKVKSTLVDFLLDRVTHPMNCHYQNTYFRNKRSLNHTDLNREGPFDTIGLRMVESKFDITGSVVKKFQEMAQHTNVWVIIGASVAIDAFPEMELYGNPNYVSTLTTGAKEKIRDATEDIHCLLRHIHT